MSELTTEQINEQIYRLQGWENLGYPAIPTWQKPGAQLWYEPKYSTDPAAALELVEEMRPHFFSVMIMGWDHTEEWCVECTPRHGHDEAVRRPFGKATSLPAAVCLAYIAWKEQGK